MSIPFNVLILGSGSAIPKKNKNHTAQLATFNGKHFLFDCGECTQIQLKKFGSSFQKIDAIFITHMHGDHYLGLPGLIFSMNLLGRQKKLKIIGPAGIKILLDFSFDQAQSRSAFPIEYIETNETEKQVVFEDEQVTIVSFPLKHKIPTTGYLMTVGRKKRKLLKEKLEKYNVPKQLRAGIADGRDFVLEGGKVIENSELTSDPERLRKFAFCTDTAYLEHIAKDIEGVDLMYHESTFLEADKKLAKEKRHSTAGQAAQIAKLSSAGKLLIGHFSNKYDSDSEFLSEARAIFSNTEIAKEGKVYEI